MRRMYAHVPEMRVEEEPAIEDTVSSAPTDPGAPEIIINEEVVPQMETQNMTMDQLREQNPELYREIMNAGFAEERQRIQDIDDLTPPGAEYATMAQEAKEKGMSAMDYHKAIVKAQRAKAESFMSARKTETEPAAKVPGMSAEMNDGKSEDELIAEHAKEVAELARSMRADMNGGMY